MNGWHPVGVFGVLIALAVSPVLGLAFGYGIARLLALLLRRATRRAGGPIRSGEWGMSAALSLSHGANAGQQAMGIVAALLVAGGELHTFSVPLWVKAACGAMLTIGTALGGWRIMRTIGQRIFRLTPAGAFSSQSASTVVILGASLLGAPVSSTQVVSSSVVGVGGGRGRWHHVRWLVVRSIAFAWVLTLPASALLGGLAFALWSLI